MQTSRHARIRKMLSEFGDISVKDLAAKLSVTPMTIRRDLAKLEQEGVLMRTHGRCVIQSPMARELSFSEKDTQHALEKAAIAEEAIQMLSGVESLFLDTGTTALHVARALPADAELQVFTNNLRVAMELFGRGIEVIVFGGALAPKSPDLVGEVAIARASDFHLDLAFVGADAVSVEEKRFYATDIPTALFSRTIQENAEQVCLLADSSKFGRRGLAVAGQIENETIVITDHGISGKDKKGLKKSGARVIAAK